MDKQTIVNFTGKLDMDSAHEVVKPEDYTYARNFDNNNQKISTLGQGSNILGTTIPENSSAGGTIVGRAKYEKENAEIVFVKIDGDSDEIRLVTEGFVQTILRAEWLNFEDDIINNAKCYDDYVVWCQGNKEPRILNIQWAKRYYEYVLFSLVDPSPIRPILDFNEWDGTLSASPALEAILYEGQLWYADAQSIPTIPDNSDPNWTFGGDYEKSYREILESTIQLIARPPSTQIISIYGTDETFVSNNLYSKLFQFAYKYEYLDGRQSVYSVLSSITFPASGETATGVKPELIVNNVLDLIIDTGGRDVAKIHIGVIDSSDPSSFKVIEILDKYNENNNISLLKNGYLVSNLLYEYRGFYNNEQYIFDTIEELYRPHDYVPRIANVQELLNDGRLVVADMKEDFNVKDVDLTTELVESTANFFTGDVYPISKISDFAFYPTRGGVGFDTRIDYDIYSIDFSAGYKAGLVFEYDIEVKYNSVTMITESVQLQLPYDKNLSVGDNRLAALRLIADSIRAKGNNSADYFWVPPSSRPDQNWWVPSAYEWGQNTYYHSGDYDSTGSIYPPASLAHRADRLYPTIPPHPKLDTDVVVVTEIEVANNESLLAPNQLELILTSVVITDVNTPTFETLKTNSRINIAIEYKDINLRKMGVYGKVSLDTGVGKEGPSIQDSFSNVIYKPRVFINSVPPIDAHYYSLVVSENTIISDYIQIPIAAVDITDPAVVGIDINTIITAQFDKNNKFNISSWVYEPLDRLRLVGKRLTDTGWNHVQEFDTEILYVDTDKFYIETPVSYVPVVGDLIEVYRLKKSVDADDDIYFEVGGDVIINNPGQTNRGHSGNSGNQNVVYDPATGITTSTYPGIQTLDYGNSFIKKRLTVNPNTATSYTYSCEDKSFSDYYVSDFYDNGKPAIISEPTDNVDYKNRLRFGGKFLIESNLNFIARFDYDNYDDLAKMYGSVNGIRSNGDTLLVLQDTKVTSYYVNKTVIKEAIDGSQTILSDKVLNDRSVSKDDYGCINPESIIKKGTHVLFFDAINGTFVRHANNGMYPVSDYGIASYSKTIGDGVLNAGEWRYNIIGQYNERNDRFYFAINREIDDNAANDTFEAFSFDDTNNQWKSFHDFTKAGVGVEMLGSLNNYMTSYINGVPYVFNSAVYNTLFGEVKETEVTKAFNESPMLVKHWKYLTVSANSDWIPYEVGDVSTDELSQISRIRLMRNTEGRRSSDIKRNLFYPNGTMRPDENDGDIMLGRTMLITFRNSDTTKATISSVIVGYDLSEKVI